MTHFKLHAPFLMILLLHLLLALIYASLIPLGEAPDEPAHFSYARFIAKNGRLPATLAERSEVGYRSVWPPLYHLLVAAPIAIVGDTPPARLKAVGDTPRRLIPTNGQTIAAFIHTTDETWPWQGVTLAWHLSRFVSVLLANLAVLMTYLVAWRLTRQPLLAAGAAAFHAFLPQALFMGSVVSDDTLLLFLSGLIFLILVDYTQKSTPLSFRHFIFLGMLLGLATVTKYNALPLWAILLLAWLIWSTSRKLRFTIYDLRFMTYVLHITHYVLSLTYYVLRFTLYILTGAALTSAWWFIFIWRNFNQVETRGLFAGSLAALSAGTSDASLRQLSAGGPIALPAPAAWLAWFTRLFQTFWGSFGGGSTIELPTWLYWLLALVCLLALIPLMTPYVLRITHYVLRFTFYTPSTPRSTPSSISSFFLFVPLFFLPLLLFRYLLSNHLTETAQGRHLFPALSLLSLAFVLGLSHLTHYLSSLKYQVSTADTKSRSEASLDAEAGRAGAVPHLRMLHSSMGRGCMWVLRSLSDAKRAPLLGWWVKFFGLVKRLCTGPSQISSSGHQVSGTSKSITYYVLRITHYALRFTFYVSLPLYSLYLIHSSYPPPIPLTTANRFSLANSLQVSLAKEINLIGYELGQSNDGILPVSLLWQANAAPSEDYLIDLTLADPTGRPIGGWLGHPIGGRYPTRAWDEGDTLLDTISLPLLPTLTITDTTLTLTLLDSHNQPANPSVTFTVNLHSPNLPTFPWPGQDGQLSNLPTSFRADHLPPGAPFTYRSTLSFVLPGQTMPPTLTAPTGQTFNPAKFITSPTASLAHFIVAANWPTGNYQLPISNLQSPISIINRPRQFTPPPMPYILNANFAGQMTLLGYDLPQNRVEPGQTFPITLHWRAEQTLGHNLVIFNHLLDATATQRGGADRIPQNFYTTFLWVPGEIVSDHYSVLVDADAPSGVYWLDVGLYPDKQPTFSLPLFANGQPLTQNSVRLGPLKVGGPPPGLTLPEAHPQTPLHLSFGNQITLLGFTLTDANDQPISNLQSPISNLQSPISNLQLYWQAASPPTADYTVFVHFLDPAGALVAQADGPPAGGAYLTSLWDPGEIILDRRSLPPLRAGRYTLRIGFYNPATGQRLPISGSPDGAATLLEFEIKP
jgi:hypothetical protein